MVFIGNTTHTVPYMLKNSHLFDELPDAYRDPAWLDRIHHYLPGWEVSPIRAEMFSTGYGFVVDYLAEILRAKRNVDFADAYKAHFTLDPSISTRDQDGIHKTFSGLMKLIHPTGAATAHEMRGLLEFAMEGRKRVKDSILRIDPTMRDTPLRFRYVDGDGAWHDVSALEETQYPQLYRRDWSAESGHAVTPANETQPDESSSPVRSTAQTPSKQAETNSSELVDREALQEGTIDFLAGQNGVSYETLLLPYLRGARRIQIIDAYIRMPHQGRNLADLLSLLAAAKDPAEEIRVQLITSESAEPEASHRQLLMLKLLKDASDAAGVILDVKFDESIHDRRITTDHGWRIDLGKGLDIWQKGTDNNYDFGRYRQEFRLISSAFSVHYKKIPRKPEPA